MLQIHWHQAMISSNDEEAHGRLVALEELVHWFGTCTKARGDFLAK